MSAICELESSRGAYPSRASSAPLIALSSPNSSVFSSRRSSSSRCHGVNLGLAVLGRLDLFHLHPLQNGLRRKRSLAPCPTHPHALLAHCDRRRRSTDRHPSRIDANTLQRSSNFLRFSGSTCSFSACACRRIVQRAVVHRDNLLNVRGNHRARRCPAAWPMPPRQASRQTSNLA